MPPAPHAAILKRFNCTAPVFVTQTPIATIWRVTRGCGGDAALKVYTDGNMHDEAPGFALQAAWGGKGAAYLYDQTEGAVLLEWLSGPSLGDMVRAGDEAAATQHLGRVAMALHETPVSLDLPPLADEFAALLTAGCAADCPDEVRHIVGQAQAFARTLLNTQTDPRPLHRDLHHDNIKGSARGFLAFDVKGCIGDRTYELANAFRNPIGCDAVFSDPRVIANRLDTWSQAFAVDRKRLLSWAFAHIGLSNAWANGGRFDADSLTQNPGGFAFARQASELLKDV